MPCGFLIAIAVMPEELLFTEGVSKPPYGPDRIGLCPKIDRFAKPADMNVDGSFIDIGFASPDAIQYLFARKHTSRILHEKLKQAIFRRPERDLSFAAGHSALIAIKLNICGANNGIDKSRIGSPEQRAHPYEKFRN